MSEIPPPVHHSAGFEVADLLAEESLPRAWSRWFRESPERLALIDPSSKQTLTYGQLDHESQKIAAGFLHAGLHAGDRVILSATTSLRTIVAYVAAQRLGLVVVPVSDALTHREFQYIIDDAKPAAAFVDDLNRVAWLGELANIYGSSDETDTASLILDRTTRDQLALIAYTSGTTGAPKGAMLSSGNLLAGAESVRIAWRWSSDDTLILALPLFHMHGLGVGLNGTLVAGACAVVLPKFSVDAVFDAAAEYGATMFFGVPTIFIRLLASDRVHEMRHLRLVVSGSAPLPADVHSKFTERAGNQIVERYGMTETLMTVSNPFDGDRRPGSVGLPLPGVEISIEPSGELLVRGPSVFSGYWKRADADAESFIGDGWFRTGDLAAVDDDGYIRINGRIKELIISGGFNVYPREVEDVLRAHPSVEDVAVAGVPSDEWGEVVAAWIVPSGDFDTEDVIQFAAQYLATYKRPRVVNVVTQLPRNSLGKVLKHALPNLD